MVHESSIPDRVKAWIGQVRTQGFDALWHRLGEDERVELVRFASEFDRGFQLEMESRWQAAADRYQTVGEVYPAYGDIAFQRAAEIVSEKINHAIRYYNQGVQALEAKMYTRALQFFDLALNIDPHMERALYNLGMAHRMMYIVDPMGHKMEKVLAQDAFRKLLKVNPDHHRAAAQIDQLERL